MKSVIDIEELLIWAYRHQEVDRRAASHTAFVTPEILGYASTAKSMHEGACYGIRLGSLPGRPMAEMIGADPSGDAMRVHDAVLDLPEVYFEWLSPIECKAWTLAEMAEAGVVASREVGRHVLAMPDGQLVPAERHEVAVTVILHARAGARPSVWEDWSGRRPDEKMGDADVMRDRMVYVVWRQALTSLAEALDGRLEGYMVAGPACSESPWSPQRRLEPLKPARLSTPKKPKRGKAMRPLDSAKK